MLLEAGILLPMEFRKGCCRWRACGQGYKYYTSVLEFPLCSVLRVQGRRCAGSVGCGHFAINAVFLTNVLAIPWHVLIVIVNE